MHQLWVIAGPNGSGKTTLARRHLIGRLPVVNPDEIAAELDPERPTSPEAAIKAGRKALLRQKELMTGRKSFAVETTLSGHRELAMMREAKAAGYKVNLVYLCTETPLASIGRIVQRTSDGGHFVPRKDIERRWGRSLANLPEAVSLADRAYLLDNSRSRMRLVVSIENGRLKRMSNFPPRWVTKAKVPIVDQSLGMGV